MDYLEQNMTFLKEFFGQVNMEQAVDEVPRTDTESTFLHKGNYYGGVYTGKQGTKKLMYSDILLKTLTPQKFQNLLKKQL